MLIQRMTVKAQPAVVRFAAFEVDIVSGDLRKHGVHIKLHDKPFQVLQALLERPGDTISRKELQERLWHGETFVEFENGLNNAISRLRETLGDSADEPQFIETVPRRGYRFIAALESPATEPPAAGPAAPTPAPAPPTTRARWLIPMAAAALILATLMYRFVIQRPAPIQSIAVLPLAYQGPPSERNHEYLADGMTGALITELSKIGTLRVISETSIRRYRGTTKPLPEIARELGVDAVVEGSVAREGNLVRINVQLVRASTDSHLWAENYSREMGSMLALQSEMARAIAREIQAKLTPQELARIADPRPVNAEAYLAYMKGRQLLSKRAEAELYAALDHFNQALRLEPNYAPAYAGIASTWEALASWGGYIPPREGFPKAKAAAKKALELDASLPEARTTLAFAFEVYDWDLKAAEREYQQVLAQNPNYALAHDRYALHLSRTGRGVEALSHARRAYELDPLSLDVSTSLAIRLEQTGHADQALGQYKKAIEMDPSYWDVYVHLADLHSKKGNKEEAINLIRRAVELSKDGPHAVSMLARIYARAGRRGEALTLLRQLEKGPNQQSYELAMLGFELGDNELALRWLANACRERSPSMAFLKLAQTEQRFEKLRADPRFQATLQCTELSP